LHRYRTGRVCLHRNRNANQQISARCGRIAFCACSNCVGRSAEPCHGPQGVGGLVKVEDKQIKVASLKADHAIKHTDEQLAKTITNGEEAMPAFKAKLTQAEIQDLVKFVRKEFQRK
jgi:mono/diheme cytochrome c family protein